MIAQLSDIDPGEYESNPPFPHVVLDGMWNQALLQEVSDSVLTFSEWDGEKQFFGSRCKRWCESRDKLPEPVLQLIDFASSPPFLTWLERLTGEENLVADPDLFGGGIHSITTGGFLKMHADFNWHEKLGLYRRLNMLIYLNHGWKECWGGDLRLARLDRESQKLEVTQRIYPHFNRTVIFTTDNQSFHGHPDPITAPADALRNSIALYYYSSVEPKGAASRKRPGTDYRNEYGVQYKTISPWQLLRSNPVQFSRKVLNRLSLGKWFRDA